MTITDKMLASLVVVGSGIKFVSHLTIEAEAYIKQSDKVLYLVNEPAMQEWIQNNNPHAESLDELYIKYPLRLQCYRAITEYILETLRQQQHVCVVLYGHPTVFAQPALDAVILARKEGYYAIALPGISAEDCLFADLLIDPGSHGCQSFEATDLLIRYRVCDPYSHLLLWQVGVIGALGHTQTHDNTKGIKILRDYLSQWYPANHILKLYEAAQYPHFEPVIQEFPLDQLSAMKISRISTLYIPPLQKAALNDDMLNALGITIDNLK